MIGTVRLIQASQGKPLRCGRSKLPPCPPRFSSETFTTRSPGKARVCLLVHRGGQCLDTCFPVRSEGKLLFPTFPQQPGPRLSGTGAAASPSQPSANTLPTGMESSAMPGFDPRLPPGSPGERIVALDLHREACAAATVLRKLTFDANAMKLLCYLMERERAISALSPAA